MIEEFLDALLLGVAGPQHREASEVDPRHDALIVLVGRLGACRYSNRLSDP